MSWSYIESVPQLTPLYFWELHRLLGLIQLRIDEVFKECPIANASEGYLKVDGVLHGRILDAVACAARVRSLVWANPRDGEPAAARGKWLAQQLRIAEGEFPTIRDPDARDSVEHFDVRLDLAAARTLDEAVERGVALAFDFVVWDEATLSRLTDLRVTCLRVYFASTKTFMNLGATINLESLRSEAIEMASRLPSLGVDPTKGTVMHIVTQETAVKAQEARGGVKVSPAFERRPRK